MPTDDKLKTTYSHSKNKSTAWKYDKEIKEGLQKNLTARRIYQDLKIDLQADISYDAVKRYVRTLKKKNPKVFARIHSLPGKEAQVDFGQGAPTLKGNKYQRPWLFKLVLSCSRHSYEEVVWHQNVETFIRCHERAFQALGGVPETILLDNLKSGVLKAHLYEPELNPVYQKFADHYGFIALPCLPRRPEHKGKTEAGVKYTQDNALKGRMYDSLEEQNAYLKQWNKKWARTRIHGTTKRQVWNMFLEEQPHLKQLPLKEFEYFKIGCRTVHADGHIEITKSYYSVPHQYLGKRVLVHYNSKWLKVFIKENNNHILIAFHRTINPGKFQTEKQHLPENKTFTTATYTRYLIKKCSKIGNECEQWAKHALQERDQRAFRPIQGILSLSSKYDSKQVNTACRKAIRLNSFRYQTVKLLCEDYSLEENPEHELLQNHELIRETGEYQKYLDLIK